MSPAPQRVFCPPDLAVAGSRGRRRVAQPRLARPRLRLERSAPVPPRAVPVAAPARAWSRRPSAPVLCLASPLEDLRAARTSGDLPTMAGRDVGEEAAAGAAGAERDPAASSPPRWRVVAGNLAAGATAGVAVEAALYPIDTIKTRMQAARGGAGLGALLGGQGGRSLYAGVWGNLLGVAPASAIFMAVYNPVRGALERLGGHQLHGSGGVEQVAGGQGTATAGGRDGAPASSLAPPPAALPWLPAWAPALVAGATAGLAASVVRVPTEVVKTRTQAGTHAGAREAVRAIFRREGLGGFFAGYRSFLLRDLPFDAIEFCAYDGLKRLYQRVAVGVDPDTGLARRQLSGPEHGLVGAAAGIVTGLSTTPLDVVKTRLMLQGSAAASTPGAARYAGVIDCFRTVAREEGIAALFAGWQPRVLWIGIGGSVFFTALEAAQRAFAPKMDPDQSKKER